MIRCLLVFPTLIVALASLCFAADPPETKSALETDPTGWLDLLQDKELKDWRRVAIPPGSKLATRNPWSVSGDGKLLVCDGVGLHEMLLYNKEFTDGIFHVEWRFKKVEGKKGYNSGVYVRNSADGKIWHQAQVGSGNVGYLFGDSPADGTLKRFRAENKVPQRGKEAGEWNTYEVTCKGKTLTLWINGAVTATWDRCEVPKGYVGLEAEGWVIEFRNLKFKERKP
jgi:hypothetical protein